MNTHTFPVSAHSFSPRSVPARGALPWMFFMDTMLAALALFILIGIRPMFLVTANNVGFVASDRYQSAESLPLSVEVDADEVIVMTDLLIPTLGQRRFYRVSPDDCVASIIVNGARIPEHMAQFCDKAGRIFDFGPYLHTGKNTVMVGLQNAGGPIGVDLVPSVTPLFFLVFLTATMALLWYGLQCCLFLYAQLRAQRTKMIYTRVVSWTQSLLPVQAFSRMLRCGRTIRSI